MKPLGYSTIGAVLALPLTAWAAPTLKLNSSSLRPDSTIRIVFDQSVVDLADLHKPQPNNILTIKPKLPGNIRWIEQNVAIFEPVKQLPMGTKFTFSTSKGIKHLDGSKVPTIKLAEHSTSAFEIARWRRLDSLSSTRTPRVYVSFNQNLTPVGAAPFFSFANKKGDKIAAKTRQATYADVKSTYYIRQSWQERHDNTMLRRNGQQVPKKNWENTSKISNGLIITPIKPLPIGEHWQVIALAGIPTSDKKATTPVNETVGIGNVEPFTIELARASISADYPRRVVIDFSHPVKTPIEQIEKLISVSPKPDKLRISKSGDSVYLDGDFTTQKEWTVSVNKQLASAHGLHLTGETEDLEIKFAHVSPSLALPSFETVQLSTGYKRFPIETVNVAEARIVVKELNHEQAVRTMQGYRSYSGDGPNGDQISRTHPLPLSLVAGKKIYDKVHTLDNPMDTSRNITLEWDKLLPKDKKNRIFFLSVEATSKKVGTRHKPTKKLIAQSFVQLTDIGLAWKLTEKEALIYAYSCQTGKPLPNVKISTFSEDAEALKAITTDANGVAMVPRKKGLTHLLASTGNDSYILPFDKELDTVAMWRFPVDYQWRTFPDWKRRVLIFTDRQLYKPGETVHIKGVVRRYMDNMKRLPKAKTVKLVINDEKGSILFAEDIKLSAHGTFDHSLTLPENNVGRHRINVQIETDDDKKWEDSNFQWEAERNQRFSSSFTVAEYRRNAFKVATQLSTPEIGDNEVTAKVSANYYMGTAVAKGSVNWYLRTTETGFYPDKFRDFLFGDHREYDGYYWSYYFGYRGDDYYGKSNNSSNGVAKLGDDGKLNLKLDVAKNQFPGPRSVRVSTEVTDARNQTLRASSTKTIHSSSHYLGISRSDKLFRVGEEHAFSIIGVTHTGKRSTEDLKVTAEITRIAFDTVKARDKNGNVKTTNKEKEVAVSTVELLVPAGKPVALPFKPTDGGRHLIKLTAKDAAGNEIVTISSHNVYGAKEYPWATEDGMKIKLIAEQQLYQPGDSARILVMSPIEGTALVTVERSGVIRHYVKQITLENPVIEVPITAMDAPNMFVSALVIRGSNDSLHKHKEPVLKLGYCTVNVSSVKDSLKVALDIPGSSHRPSANVTVAGRVTDVTGKPVANAEVTLYAEDNGVLDVIGYKMPKPLSYFNQPLPLSVHCGTSLPYFLPETEIEEFSFVNKGFTIGGGVGYFGSAVDDPTSKVRSNFDPCAVWKPRLITNDDGEFTVTFKSPDTLTSYRVMAVALSGADKFGSTKSEFVVNKPLMLKPAAPRFANEGDSISNKILVANNSEFNGTWKVTLETSSLTQVNGSNNKAELTVSLMAGESKNLTFDATFVNSGEAKWKWSATPLELKEVELTSALRRDLSDAVTADFSVTYPRPIIRDSHASRLQGKPKDLLDGIDRRLLNGRGHIEFDLAISRLHRADRAAEHLLKYPYGCVEQTTSSMMPWFAVNDLKPYIADFAKTPDEKVSKAIQKGAKRLLTMQTEDGGLAYWPGGENSETWASSYGGLGLILAKQHGAAVPDKSIKSLVRYIKRTLRKQIDQKNDWELTSACRALYVLSLAGSPDNAYMNTLLEKKDKLSGSARGFLALAIHKAQPDNKAALQLLESTAKNQNNSSFMSYRAHDQVLLLALCEIDSDNERIDSMLEKLMGEANAQGHWNTTWCNAWTVNALASYARNVEANMDAVTVEVSLPDGSTKKLSLGKEKRVARISLPIQQGMKVSCKADGKVFTNTNIFSKPESLPMGPTGKNGLTIIKTYERVLNNGKTEPLTNPMVGDLVKVTLDVHFADTMRYVVIDDPLPSTFEAVNSDFATQASEHQQRRNWRVSNQELRDDRALFFLNRSWSRGNQKLSYLARITASGKVAVPPAKVEAMYDPKSYALSASGVMTCTPKQ